MEEKYIELIKNADAGDVVSLLELAQAYFDGEVHGFREFGMGLECVEKAAKQGNPAVQNICAKMYEPLGLYETAFKWFMEAALQGHADSQAMVAQYYYTGIGADKDAKKAFKWAQKAYDNGEECTAPTVLGAIYLDGNVVKRDIRLGYKMIKLGAKNGNEGAADIKKSIEEQIPEIKKL